MAHEINNPASSAQRGAAQLQALFSQLQNVHLRLGQLQLNESQLEHLVTLYRLVRERARKPVELNALVRSDRESELETWLANRDLDTSGEVAPALVDLGYGADELQSLEELFPGQQFSLVVDWLSCMYGIYSLVDGIGLGTGRIVEIVKALKSYTYMDQAPVQSVDVREGLDNTLIILHNKLKGGVEVVKDYAEDLPEIQAFASELNQVWTNLIDNAADAIHDSGTADGRIKIAASARGDALIVTVENNGPEISPSVRGRIFEAFFTTKEPGKGTGLGLDTVYDIVVNQHRGTINVDSDQERTIFRVELPIAHPGDRPD
jgi:signal transduction histidine kinase